MEENTEYQTLIFFEGTGYPYIIRRDPISIYEKYKVTFSTIEFQNSAVNLSKEFELKLTNLGIRKGYNGSNDFAGFGVSIYRATSRYSVEFTFNDMAWREVNAAEIAAQEAAEVEYQRRQALERRIAAINPNWGASARMSWDSGYKPW